jgi:hypothetical protein
MSLKKQVALTARRAGTATQTKIGTLRLGGIKHGDQTATELGMQPVPRPTLI